MSKPVHEELNCQGYYGFGGGYQLGKTRQGGALYCNQCPLAKACWEAHRARVAALFPAVTEDFEQLAEQLKGPELMKAWYERHDTADPYTIVMGGNMEDGARVAAGFKPADRGWATITYPFDLKH